MIEILGKKHLTVKEASRRYGMSEEWFSKRRFEKKPPRYSQIGKGARVLYPLIETDQWFENEIRMKEGA